MTSHNQQNNWIYEDIKSVHLELSTLCNSICPWCPRYRNFSPNINPNITEGSYSLDRFKKHFPKDFIERIEFWTFAGDYGDPCTASEILLIIEYILSIKDCAIQINTNGGMRTTGFWHELGKLMREDRDKLFTPYQKRYVIFSVDGLEDTNHIYRRNVRWNKVINAMRAYSNTGARGIWEFLKFKHNEHQTTAAGELAKELGFEIRFKNPNGFEGGPMPARDKDYKVEYYIEPAEGRTITPIKETTKEFIDLINTDKIQYDDFRSRVESFYKDRTSCINCSARTFGAGNEVRINFDGTVWPCSFFGHLSKKYLKDRYVSTVHQWQIHDIFKDIKNNLDDMTLKDILDSDPFKGVYDKWEGNKIMLCSDNCGETKRMEKIYA